MAKLILEEGGQTRRFKLASGKLTFGSGEKATLRLESDDVAELHGQIDMGPDGAVLRTAKGVMPAKVSGRPVSGAHTMRDGQAVQVGSAKLTVEYDEGEGPAQAAGPATARASAGTPRVSRRRPKAKKSAVPSFVLVPLILGAAGFGAYALLTKTSKGLSGAEFDFDTRWARYQREKGEDAIGARTILGEISREALTAQQRALVDAEFAEGNEELEVLDEDIRNQKAMDWFSKRLENYFEDWPVTKERAHARLFMKRATWFVEEYPTHPERERVQRWMDRVRPVAEVGSPMEVEDLRVDVWGSVSAAPKDFRSAIDSISAFLATAEGSDRTAAEQIRTETLGEERTFYDEKLGEAAVVYDKAKYPDKFDPSLAINDMVTLIAGLQDTELRADAARRLLAITEFSPGKLSAYKRERPDIFEKLLVDPSIRAFAEENDLL
ncbi:MAG: FHA domain-containing protein [Planctomycetota bacterium]